MCAQCMMGAATTVGAAAGSRAWLASRLSPRALRRAWWLLATAAVVASGLLVGGT